MTYDIVNVSASYDLFVVLYVLPYAGSEALSNSSVKKKYVQLTTYNRL